MQDVTKQRNETHQQGMPPEARKTAPQKIFNNLFMMIAPWVLH